MIAVSRVSVNHDGRGGAAPAVVWDRGSRAKQREVDIRVDVDLAALTGPPGFLAGPWVQVTGGSITESDVTAGLCSVGLLSKFSSFLGFSALAG